MISDQTLRARLLLINCPVHERVSMDQERKGGERECVCKRFEIKRTFEGAKNSVSSKYYFLLEPHSFFEIG